MLDANAGRTLLAAARCAIERGLDNKRKAFENHNPDPALREPRASFVTLKRHAALRGCIGSLDIERPLLDDVMRNARAAAFQDPRFPPLAAAELENLRVEISVLSVAEAIPAENRAQLLGALQAGEDGVIVQEGARRATFLPAVWRQLPDAESFYAELMQKAGLGTAHWSSSLRFFRYHTESFTDEEHT